MADEQTELEQRKYETLSGVTAAPMFMCLAIVSALKSKGLLEPADVAKFAEVLSSAGQHNAPPLAIATMQARVKEFAMMVRALDGMPSPPGGPA